MLFDTGSKRGGATGNKNNKNGTKYLKKKTEHIDDIDSILTG